MNLGISLGTRVRLKFGATAMQGEFTILSRSIDRGQKYDGGPKLGFLGFMADRMCK